MKTGHALTEDVRVYTFANEQTVTIEKVRNLAISASGNHRLITEDKRLHIVPKGWLHIEIQSEKGWEL